MPPADVVKHFPGGPRASAGYVIQALANGFVNIRACDRVEEALVYLRVLDDGPGLTLDREYDGPFALLGAAS
jgi:hypothetical protein